MNILIESELISKYNEEGYLLMKNVIPRQNIDELTDFIAHVIKIEATRIGLVETKKEKLLNEIIIKIRKDNPVSSSWIYEAINNSNIFKKFIYNLGFEEIVSKMIQTKNVKSIGTISPSLRIDIPHDTKNTRDWHQDGHYFLDNDNGFNSLVVWISLINANKENGTVIVCPGSHQDGKIKSVHEQRENLKSEQYIAPQEVVDKYKKINVNTSIGDAAFIQMDLIHKSGFNSSNTVRYTAQIRFTNIEKDDYSPPQLIPKYLQYKR